MEQPTWKCNFCGHETPVIPPREHDGVLVPGRLLFDECPRCRDQFAMAAPFREESSTLYGNDSEIDAEFLRRARLRYRWADAMLKARQKE